MRACRSFSARLAGGRTRAASRRGRGRHLKFLWLSSLLTAIVVTAASIAWCATMVGAVCDAAGNPVKDVKIGVREKDGHSVANAISDARGRYAIDALRPGVYRIESVPAPETGLKGEKVVAAVGPGGLTVEWRLSSARAMAAASVGLNDVSCPDPPAQSPLDPAMEVATWAGLIGSLAVGGVIAGLARFGDATTITTTVTQSPSQ